MSTPREPLRSFFTGTKLHHGARDEEFELPTRNIRVRQQGGYSFRSVPIPLVKPALSDIIRDLEKSRTATVTLSVVGILAVDHDSGTWHFEAGKRLWFGVIKQRESLLRNLRTMYVMHKNNQSWLRIALSDTMGVEWSHVYTVYIDERPPLP